MARRKQDPAAAFVAWCETAPIDTVETVLGICLVAVKRRQDAEKQPKPRVVKPRSATEPIAANDK